MSGRKSMSKTQPIDNLAPLAKAGVPILHDCGSLDPWLKERTLPDRRAETAQRTVRFC
jgi:hypothetical protein